MFVPGYAWTLLLFADKEKKAKEEGMKGREKGIDRLERLALSVGLSIAIVPLAVFYLNRFAGMPISFWSIAGVVLVLAAVPIVLARRWKGLGKA